jgi:hypothetical protein
LQFFDADSIRFCTFFIFGRAFVEEVLKTISSIRPSFSIAFFNHQIRGKQEKHSSSSLSTSIQELIKLGNLDITASVWFRSRSCILPNLLFS